MCEFKSGIILKDRCYIANTNSHSDMLKELGIDDTYLNATKTFVRAELLPANKEWWTNPETWRFRVDQDITTEWFELDRQKYEDEFRTAVKSWHKEHVLVDQEIEELTSGVYRLKGCKVKKLLNDVKVDFCYNSKIGEMWDNSKIGIMQGSSQIGIMRGSSQIGEMKGSSKIDVMRDNSQIDVMWDNSQIGEMWDSSQIIIFES